LRDVELPVSVVRREIADQMAEIVSEDAAGRQLVSKVFDELALAIDERNSSGHRWFRLAWTPHSAKHSTATISAPTSSKAAWICRPGPATTLSTTL
jgi:hypothetical protein